MKKKYKTPILRILFIYLNLKFQPNPSNGLVFIVVLELGIWDVRICDFPLFSQNGPKSPKNLKFCKTSLYY